MKYDSSRQRMGRRNVIVSVAAMVMWGCAHQLLFCVVRSWFAIDIVLVVAGVVVVVVVVDTDAQQIAKKQTLSSKSKRRNQASAQCCLYQASTKNRIGRSGGALASPDRLVLSRKVRREVRLSLGCKRPILYHKSQPRNMIARKQENRRTEANDI